jgi:hypothetical protein
MNNRSKTNTGRLAVCIATAMLLFSCSQSTSTSTASTYSAYREDATLLGNIDVAAIRNSDISKSLSDSIPLDQASNLGFSKEDVVKISFSATLPDSDDDDAYGTALVLLDKEVTLDQLAQMIDQQNATKEDDDKVVYTKDKVEGVDVLIVELPVDNGLLPEGATDEDSVKVYVTTLPSGKQTYVAIASPDVFGDLVHKRNPSELPAFAKEGSAKLSNKDQGFLVLKITPEMKEGLQEISRSIKEDPAALGMPFPPSMADNLPNIKYIGVGTTLKDNAVIELQAVFDSADQATGFAAGLTNVIAGLQFAMAMALANSPEEMNVIPTFTQANSENAASILLTISKANQ